MKKFLLLIAVVSLSLAAMSQKGKVTVALSYIDQGILDKAKEAIDQALANEKTMYWSNTYFAKGKLCQATFESKNQKFKAYYPDPLAEAYISYEKALELDPKGVLKKKLITSMIYNSLAVNLYSQGSSRFEAKDFVGALTSFETQIKITESDKYIGALDTGMYYNAGLAAVNANKFNEALKYFQKCADLKYQGLITHIQIYESYMGIGDTAKAEAYLLTLPNKFPGDKNVIFQLIDFYMKKDKYDEAFKYLKSAKEVDPNNYSLFYASGVILLKQNKFDDAITDLTRSIEIKSDSYDTQYALSLAFINKAADLNIKANEIMDVKKYNEAVDDLNAVYVKALPYMEKANELKPDDIDTMTRLQELYYRLKIKDASLNQKYLNIKAKIDAIKKN